MSSAKLSGHFVEPMLLVRTESLPDDATIWRYELKHDGYRSIAFKTGGKLYLRSRNDNDFAARYPAIAKALISLPNDTVIDGEIVAFDTSGKPSFNVLQNHGTSGVPLFYYVFDVMMLAGKSVMGEPLERRQEVLEQEILPRLKEPIR